MTFALVEVEAMAKKATRGAGYSWGLGEEAAKAVRWLCAAGLDGVGVLVFLLEQTDDLDKGGLAPLNLRDWKSGSGAVCSLMAGTTLSDSSDRWREKGVQITNAISPVLLVPFAASCALEFRGSVSVEWGNCRIVTDGRRVWTQGDDFRPRSESVVIEQSEMPETFLEMKTRATPIDKDWARLGEFAHRTYAPDTDESRLKGAGAGLNDND